MNLEKRLKWLRSLPDFRDYHSDHPEIQAVFSGVGSLLDLPHPGDPACDLGGGWLPPIRDQGDLGSCTAHSIKGPLEYYGRRYQKEELDFSARYLYKATRTLAGDAGDTGAEIRDTMKALRLFGCSPEEYWPYDVKNFDARPDWRADKVAGNFQAIKYVRLKTLAEIKAYLRAGFPVSFGFTVYGSIKKVGPDGLVPFPAPQESVLGGHAVWTVGYDDPKGALRFVNSWGTEWGDAGCGWLPYPYFDQGLADDFWVLLKNDWVDLEAFN